MPRLPRPVADGLLYHALNRDAVFAGDADFRAFLAALGQTRQRYPFQLYGYCLMTNHFHLLLQPERVGLVTLYESDCLAIGSGLSAPSAVNAGGADFAFVAPAAADLPATNS